MILSSHGLIASQIASFDADAVAFFGRVTSAGGTLSLTEKQAVNTLVVQMKFDGIWNSMKAIYPMVGASAAACSQNLKSSSFTGTFTATGWTFASTGVTPDGTSAYMDTTITPSTSLSLNSAHVSSYIRTTNGGNQAYVGCFGSAGGGTNLIYLLNFGFFQINGLDNPGTGIISENGFFLNTRTSASNVVQYKNTTALNTSVSASTGLGDAPIYIGAYNANGTPVLRSNNQTAFSSIGDGLNTIQEDNFYTAVQAFQTTLSRQV